ncbi:trypsin-like peptidase domain-containing protein [Nonomuraea sp. NEAU-A123]|uniref:trypsin-like peptidase domain-containing protein n=1 Tax=Nonomuraea sp. NEAU-A123 TaxID=2839649 RepID=UPI001BE48454|nr:trypsin-like peptidase domain-containing protein [Nonomuraea sp. NEAU-A123]MBT2224738.1 S1C family serine protease [Nonomuraea sp. NEAU-A123]
MMRWLWLPILLVLTGCSIMVPWSLPIRHPAPTGEAVSPAKFASEKRSVVRLSGMATSCDKQIEGTGFVFTLHRVVTPAHVVAGVTESLTVTADDGKAYEARVVAFDPDVDVAVLYAPDLPAHPLLIDAAPLGEAHLIGYPKGAKQPVWLPAAMEQTLEAEGPNIYRKHDVTRTVIAISADMSPGLSGAPLIVPGGTVAGMAFAAATSQPNRGYVLPAEELLPITNAASETTKRVSTHECD